MLKGHFTTKSNIHVFPCRAFYLSVTHHDLLMQEIHFFSIKQLSSIWAWPLNLIHAAVWEGILRESSF